MVDEMTTQNPPRVRFAPSPTGMVHVGNARTALYNWLYARRSGGSFVVRVEDTDLERSEARFEDQLLNDMRWLGLDWDEGPQNSADPGKGEFGPYRQSQRLEIYAKHTDKLLAEGKAYRCFCVQEELEAERAQAAANQLPQVYSRKCLKLSKEEVEANLAAGKPFAVRLKIEDHPLRFHDIVRGDVEFPAETVSDPILVRSATGQSAGVPVYNYVVTVDDALMGITTVIRGDDHISNTPKQVAIYEAFGWKVPEFAHLSTILGSDREKLSKRHGATSITSFREMGYLPEALVNYLALLGWGAEDGKSETFTLTELAKVFSLERVTPSPAVFDFDKLNWLNRHYIKLAAPERLAEIALPYFAEKLGSEPTAEVKAWLQSAVAVLAPYVDHLDQLPEKAAILFEFAPEKFLESEENQAILGAESAKKVIAAMVAKLKGFEGEVTGPLFKEWINEVKVEVGVKGKDLFHPIRVAMTGHASGPDFDKTVPLMEVGAQLGLPIVKVLDRLERFV